MNRRSPPDGESRLHLWPAPSVHLQSPPPRMTPKSGNRFSDQVMRTKRGGHGRKVPKVRGRQSPAACGGATGPANTGAERSEKRTERAGRIRAIGSRPRRRCKLDKKVPSAPSARQYQTGRLTFSRRRSFPARDRYPNGPKSLPSRSSVATL